MVTKGDWTLDEEHPLGCLHGERLAQASLEVLLGPKNRYGARYFQVFLKDNQGRSSTRPALIGLHNAGAYPGYNWIEIISFIPQVTFPSGGGLDLPLEGVGERLFQLLADLIPPGGHLMVEYESPAMGETACSLAQGIPPVATLPLPRGLRGGF